ncbi:putative acetyltransferase [Pseudovibrio axinellae]|uniref:Putative acetyltransferase n=2 Tax=Pseudovibrio axinellae TaxID=989403 RepID=A0A166AQU7_9HYPH|nr:putative acetyltransferase [Pseudovibrio axinellae]SER05314.1 Acetyltransferase (GNAT) domain-containing protein [Pseudovibrio axinellae]
MHVQMTPAHTSQAVALTNIMHAAKGHWDYDPQDLEEFRAHWKITPKMIEEHPVLVISQEDRPVGFARIIKESPETALLDCLFVLPQAHGKGYGVWLLHGAETVAKRLHCTKLRLESDANAAPFYEKHGYHPTGSRASAFKRAKAIQLMEKALTAQIHEVREVDLILNSTAKWSFAAQNRQDISQNWQALIARTPALWDGKVLLVSSYTFKQGKFSAELMHIDYSAFLAWRDWGFPDKQSTNLFGCTVIRSREGDLIFGKMGENTAAAGQVYPPGGNLDQSDITPNGKVDIIASIARELEEETGLKLEQGELGRLLVIEDGPHVAIAQILTFPLTNNAILSKIADFNANQQEPELEEAVIINPLPTWSAITCLPMPERSQHTC